MIFSGGHDFKSFCNWHKRVLHWIYFVMLQKSIRDRDIFYCVSNLKMFPAFRFSGNITRPERRLWKIANTCRRFSIRRCNLRKNRTTERHHRPTSTKCWLRHLLKFPFSSISFNHNSVKLTLYLWYYCIYHSGVKRNLMVLYFLHNHFF